MLLKVAAISGLIFGILPSGCEANILRLVSPLLL